VSKTLKPIIGIRVIKFFYIIGWIIKYSIKHKINPAILSRLNPELPNGGKCTLSKSYIYEYFTQNNSTAKKYFAEYIRIPKDTSWNKTKILIKKFDNKKIVLKPDKGIRSTGVMATNSENKIRQLLDAAKTDYLIQEYIDYKYELGVFYYKYPTWKNGKILGIAERTFEEIVDPHDTEQYTNRSDLITPYVTEVFNKIVGNKKIYFCRFDVRAKNLEEFKKGQFKILEANAGPDAVALHALDKTYTRKKQLKLYSEEYVHAFNIANTVEIHKNKPKANLIKYFWFMIKDDLPLRLLNYRTRKIINNK